MEYNRIMLGQGSKYATQCRAEGFIGADFGIHQDITEQLQGQLKDVVVSLFLSSNPDKSKVVAGISCGYLWTICHGLKIGDIVLCPNGEGAYMVGKIDSDYYYVAGGILPHRRKVKWFDKLILRSEMSETLRHSTGSIGTCCNITKYSGEIQTLLNTQTTNHMKTDTPSSTINHSKKYVERDLHKIFCSFARERLGVFATTIYHEKSSTGKDKGQKWVHPDIIGVAFSDIKKDETKSLMRAIKPDAAVTIYSFEMKREINTDYELKEYYFQALSNSSWANRGYLVAYEISEELKEEMARLNNAFGIGIIHLHAHNAETEILYQAKDKELDFATIDKVCNINPDFAKFMDMLSKYLYAGKEFHEVVKQGLKSMCDKEIFKDDEDVETYCKAHNIPF